VYEANLAWLKEAEVAVPELILVDEASGALVFSTLAGSSLHDQLRGHLLDYGAIGTILARLSTLPASGLRQRRPSDVEWWLQQVADWDPEKDGAFARAVEGLLTTIGTVEPGPPGWEHGDLHDRNLFVGEAGELGMIDLDQAGMGDSQADMVCLTAHLELRAIQQGHEHPEREIRELWGGFGIGVFPLRARRAVAAELARLACLYRFRAQWRPLTRSLLARAQGWLQPVRTRPASATEGLRMALKPGWLSTELAAAGFDWLHGPITGVEVTRVGAATNSFVLDVDVAVGGSHRQLIAEIPRTGDPALALASTVEGLRKKRRGQRPTTAYGIGLLPRWGMLVRAAGLDRRLPVLRLLHARLDEGGLVGAEVLSHRLGKRVTIRKPGGEIIKGYKSRSPLPEETFALGGILAAAGPPLGGPQPLGILAEMRAVVWKEETPAPPTQYDVPAPLAVTLTGAALRELHALEGLEHFRRYDVALELAGIRRQARLVSEVRPGLKRLVAAALASAADRAGQLEPSFERPIHRDAHPGQFIVQPDRALVIDVDTFALGDPAIDLGNYSAHLSLQGAEEVSEELLAAYGADRALRRRVEVWHNLSLLRLALDGLLSTGRAQSSLVVLRRLE
jgi:Ser/Thr protein kinase RdoA (MazF antagonist)